MTDVLALVAIGLLAGAVGVAFGIFFVAPRLSRLADRADEEPSDRDD